jgi:hypothetical protein
MSVNVDEGHFVRDGAAWCSAGAVCEMECARTVFWKMPCFDSKGCKAICVYLFQFISLFDSFIRGPISVISYPICPLQIKGRRPLQFPIFEIAKYMLLPLGRFGTQRRV